MSAAVPLQTEELLQSLTLSHLISCLSEHPRLFDLCIIVFPPIGGAIAAG